MALTKAVLSAKVAELMGVPACYAMEAVQDVLDVIIDELKKDGRVELRGFGVFQVTKRKASVGRNPRVPGSRVEIPSRYVLKFKPGKEIVDALQKKSAGEDGK